jgi:transposase
MIDQIPVFIKNTIVPPKETQLTHQQAKEIYYSNMPVKILAYRYNVGVGTIYGVKSKRIYKAALVNNG